MIRELEETGRDLAAEYVRQPVNFGETSESERISAHDGFMAGFEAGVKAGLALAEGAAS